MRDKDRSADRRIALIASRQHGNITTEQLLAAGLTRAAITRRVDKGVLHRVFRGVYRVGHMAPSVEAHNMAAVLACGEGGVLSGRAAAHLYGLLKGGSPAPEVSIQADRRVPGVITHRVRSLARSDRTTFQHIPIVSVARVLVDLAEVLEPEELGRVCHAAGIRYRVRKTHVTAALGRKPNAPGSRELRDIYSGRRPILLSRLEREFRRRLRGDALVLPETNRVVDGLYVDCRWPDRRLTVELDSYTYHHSRHAWEQDRRREREARGRGDEFRRYTWHDVFEEPGPMLAELRKLLLG